MDHTREDDQRVTIREVVTLLSQTRLGNRTSELTDGAARLKPIHDEVNALAQHLKGQAQEQIQRYEYILDGAGLGSWDWWLESNAVNFDRRWCEMLGLNFDQTPQHLSTWDARVHPEDKAKTFQDINAYLAGETRLYENIHRMLHADGHWVWILDRGRISEFNASGKPMRFTGTHFDVTFFIEQQSLSEEIQQIAKIGGWELDALTGKTRWTPETYHIHAIAEGTPTDKIMGVDFYAPHEREKITCYVVECLRGAPFHDIFEFLDAKGNKKSVEVMGKPLFDINGSVYKVMGTFQDVSEKIQREEESRSILDALGIGVWQFNPATRSLFWDKSMYELFDVSEKNFSTHYSAWENSLTPEAKTKAVEELEMALRGEKEFNTTFEINTKSHGRRYIAGRAKVIRDKNGDPIMMYGVNLDRTKEESTAKELEIEKLKSIRNAKLASLGEMSAGIAHEINNPLTIIYGTVRALSKTAHNPEQLATNIEKIHLAVKRIAKIVKSLQKFSRTSDKAEYNVHLLSGIVNEALILTEAKARRHTTLVEFKCMSDSHILCDEIEIEQVFVNLINNAIDAVRVLPEKWVTIELQREAKFVTFRIRDSGPRISPEIEMMMYQPFFTTKPIGQGTGLGLSIAKGILDEHKASIEVVRDDPHTCFEVQFPRAEPNNHAP